MIHCLITWGLILSMQSPFFIFSLLLKLLFNLLFQVDDNVTRHLPYELSRTDWDILILHFLGLDHIGHFAGPMSPLIGPKLLEMDKIVQEIIEAIMKSNKEYDQDSLFVLTSDHGMNDAGSHGGASAPEILCPLVFTSPSMMNGKGRKLHLTL